MNAPALPPLRYRCPICGDEVAVPGRMIGETVRCPNESCRHPMLVEPPKAEFLGVVQTDQEDASAATPAMVTQTPVDAERTLMTLRPVMARNSPIRFGLAWLGVAGGLTGLVWAATHANAPLAIVSAAVALLLLATLGAWWLDTLATSLTVTTRRTTLRRGIFDKHTNEVQHDDVRNLQVEQSLLNRVLGVGTVKISSSGQDDVEIEVAGIPHPTRVAETIRGT